MADNTNFNKGSSGSRDLSGSSSSGANIKSGSSAFQEPSEVGSNYNDYNKASSENKSSSKEGPANLEDALKLLDDAATSQAKQITELIDTGYNHIRSAIEEIGPQIQNAFGRVLSEGTKAIRDIGDMGAKRTRLMATNVSQEVKNNPIPFLGTLAFGALVAGFLLGRGFSGRSSGSVSTDFNSTSVKH